MFPWDQREGIETGRWKKGIVSIVPLFQSWPQTPDLFFFFFLQALLLLQVDTYYKISIEQSPYLFLLPL